MRVYYRHHYNFVSVCIFSSLQLVLQQNITPPPERQAQRLFNNLNHLIILLYHGEQQISGLCTKNMCKEQPELFKLLFLASDWHMSSRRSFAVLRTKGRVYLQAKPLDTQVVLEIGALPCSNGIVKIILSDGGGIGL